MIKRDYLKSHVAINKSNQKISYCRNNTGHEITLEEDFSFPYPWKMKNRNAVGEKIQLKHLWQ